MLNKLRDDLKIPFCFHHFQLLQLSMEEAKLLGKHPSDRALFQLPMIYYTMVIVEK